MIAHLGCLPHVIEEWLLADEICENSIDLAHGDIQDLNKQSQLTCLQGFG